MGACLRDRSSGPRRIPRGAFDLAPQSAVAGSIGRIDALRDDPLERHRAGFFMKRTSTANLVIAVAQRRADIREQFGETRLALDQRPRADVVAVEIQKIEQ